MPPKIQSRFQNILQQGIRQRLMPAKTKQSRDWYREKARELFSGENINKQSFIKQGNDGEIRKKITPASISPGEMIYYNYDPKWKDILPVYDTFPLVFPFRIQRKYMWGLNIHYLPHKERAELLDALYSIVSDKRYNRNTKLNLTYKVLQNVAKKENYEPTIHCYLLSHIKSQIKKIEITEWDIVSFMPLARFRGKDASRYQIMQ